MLLAKISGPDPVRRAPMLAPKGAAALYFLEKLVIDGLIVVGLISGHSAAGLNLFSPAVFARALGIGIGLAVGGARRSSPASSSSSTGFQSVMMLELKAGVHGDHGDRSAREAHPDQ